ncbi:hypothetical protein DMH15_37220 [Streptomyces sp. WAC 06725]|nr:hypothetical protein DMH15_37220 [Streptomyces sp. WAC 06725]
MVPDEIDVALVEPRCLAGGGDPSWITVALHQAGGWSYGHDPLMPRVLLSSPDQQALLRLEPDADGPWWRLQHAATDGQRAWSASFGARTPVEIIAGLTDALTVPKTASAADPYEPLHRAGWRTDYAGKAFLSPDGYVRIEHFTHRSDSFWFARAALPTVAHGLIWQAHLSGETPPHLVAGFTRALADDTPLRRDLDPTRIPYYGTPHTRVTRRRVPAATVASALEHRVKDLTARRAGAPPPAPQPPETSPRRTR